MQDNIRMDLKERGCTVIDIYVYYHVYESL
jgi:hypothetical protein